MWYGISYIEILLSLQEQGSGIMLQCRRALRTLKGHDYAYVMFINQTHRNKGDGDCRGLEEGEQGVGHGAQGFHFVR